MSQGTHVLLGAVARIWVEIVLLICQESRSTCLPAGRVCKNCDEPINFIVRVSKSVVFLCEAGFVLKAQFLFLVLEQD